MRPSKNNIKAADESEDQECHFCGDDNPAIVIRGNKNSCCNTCGNEIVMCQFCYSVMVNEADKILGR